MLKSRFIIGITVASIIGSMLFYCGAVRYADVTNPWRYHMSGYPGYPPIGIVRWWSYLAPIALGAGVAAWLRRPLPKMLLLAAAAVCSALSYTFLRVAFEDSPAGGVLDLQKFLWPGQTPPIDMITLGGNIALIGTSVFFASFTLSKLRTEQRAQRDLKQFSRAEITDSLQPVMNPYLNRPSRFSISPMLRTRIIIGLVCALLIALPLYLVGSVRYQTHYSSLIEAHTRGGFHFELPWAIQLLWPFGMVRRWSYIAPLAIGAGIACRLRNPVSTFPLVVSLLGAFMICTISWQSFHLYAKMFSYMGYPATDPIEPEIFWGNMLAITLSLSFAIVSAVGRITDPPENSPLQ